jgi:hypothetical protein
MSDLKLKDGDLVIKNGDFVLTKNLAEQVTQALRIQLKMLQGEWFLDERVGIPYFTQILGQKPHKLTLLGIFREAILQVDGVAKITQIDIDYDHRTRAVKIDFEVELTDGQKVKLYV